MIRFCCAICNARLKVSKKLAGREVLCTRCRTSVTVPRARFGSSALERVRNETPKPVTYWGEVDGGVPSSQPAAAGAAEPDVTLLLSGLPVYAVTASGIALRGVRYEDDVYVIKRSTDSLASLVELTLVRYPSKTFASIVPISQPTRIEEVVAQALLRRASSISLDIRIAIVSAENSSTRQGGRSASAGAGADAIPV
jgi:hypothetical protein